MLPEGRKQRAGRENYFDFEFRLDPNKTSLEIKRVSVRIQESGVRSQNVYEMKNRKK